MNLHKTTHMEETINSNETSDYELKSDTLDQLYKEQLRDLRELVFKKAQASDVEICRKWLKIFNRTSKAEKMSRNCLCTLMLQQIKEYNVLGEPFTNLQNCNRDLECVLRELDDTADSCRSSHESFSSVSNATFKSHCINMPNVEEPSQNMVMLHNECRSNQCQIKTVELKQEMDNLRLQLTEKQIENVKLKEIAEKCYLEKEQNEERLDNIKKSILDGVREKLMNLEQNGMMRPDTTLFEDIFQNFSKDKEFMEILRKYDFDFQHILSKHFEHEYNKRKTIIARHICRKFSKSKSKMREKYERRLMMQKLQLKLVKLECFSVLRQIFINSHSEFGKIEMWEVLKLLEEKYQNIVNDDIK